MRTLLTALTALMLLATPVMAGDWEDAKAAYEAGDYKKAFRITKRSAEKGDARAQWRLGKFYAKGQGVKQSDIEAYAWWEASAYASTYSERAKDKLATYMSERDIAKAKKIAGEYWKKYVLPNSF